MAIGNAGRISDVRPKTIYIASLTRGFTKGLLRYSLQYCPIRGTPMLAQWRAHRVRQCTPAWDYLEVLEPLQQLCFPENIKSKHPFISETFRYIYVVTFKIIPIKHNTLVPPVLLLLETLLEVLFCQARQQRCLLQRMY